MDKDNIQIQQDESLPINKQNFWALQKEKGSLLGMHCVVWIFKILGANICKIFVSPILLYYFCISPKSKAALDNYLTRLKQNQITYPHSSFRSAKLRIFFNFAYAIIDRFSVWTGQYNFDKIHRFGFEDVEYLWQENKGAVILLAHLGNFEMARAAKQNHYSAAKYNIIVHTRNAQKITQIMQNINANYSAEFIAVEDLQLGTLMRLKDKLDQGEFIVIAADRISPSQMTDYSNNTVTAQFLGKSAQFPIGPYLLASFLECPVLSIFCLKDDDIYKVFFHKITDRIHYQRKERMQVCANHAQIFANLLAHYVRKYPLQWYNFYPFWQE